LEYSLLEEEEAGPDIGPVTRSFVVLCSAKREQRVAVDRKFEEFLNLASTIQSGRSSEVAPCGPFLEADWL
jgi:hypothetical protein